MCNSVDLPAPDGATSATDCPAHTASSALLRISSVASPWWNCRLMPCRKTSGYSSLSAVDVAASLIVVVSSIAA